MAITMDRVRRELGLPGRKTTETTPSASSTSSTSSTSSAPAPGPDQPPEDQSAGPRDASSQESSGSPGVRGWFRRRQEIKRLSGKFAAYPHLLALKPKEKYLFRSDHFEVDGSVACVLAFFHDDAAHDNFGAFWGINRIPAGLDERVTTVVLEQISRKSEKWVDSYIKTSEKLEKLDAGEQEDAGTASSRRRTAKISGDIETITGEIQDGASYLSVQNRLLVKAPDLETLDDTIDRIERLYIDRFGTVKIAAYAGEQRRELSSLWKNNDKKRGKGFGYTSAELAGSHSLVTNGLNDATGEYVGHMVGDVNNSAVLFDADAYEHHVVIADEAVNTVLNRAHVPDMWASKLAQSCLLNNGSVVHLVLDGADLNRLGPPLEMITSRVDLNAGEVNMFEMFGETADELSIFAAQMQKLTLMFEQVYEATDADRSIIRGELEKTATQFYIDQGMWHRNAKEQRDRLRVVGVPHEHVPRLQMFTTYLDTEHEGLLKSAVRDDEKLHAYGVLGVAAKNLLDNNGDLFNNVTAPAIDGVRDARRVVYDFSRLMRRGKGVAMAQLVNIVGFAVGKLEHGDTVIIHGTESIDDRVKSYIEMQIEHLWHRGGRVVYCYNSVDKMLTDQPFNCFDAADYTILGAMREQSVAQYQDKLHQRIPPDLAKLMTTRGANLSYLRRGVSNVIFHLDLALGVNPHREQHRQRLHAAARQAAITGREATSTPRAAANTTGLITAAPRPGAPDKLTDTTGTSRAGAARRFDRGGG